MLANLLAAAAAHGLAVRVRSGFADDAVAHLVGLDGVEEVPLVVVQLGEPDFVVPPAGSLAPIAAASAPIAPRVLHFPLADEAHSAGALNEDAVARWRDAGQTVSRPAPAEIDPPAGADAGRRIENVILARGSTRVFRVQRAAPELLEWALPAAARAVPFDAAAGGTLIEHLVNVHDVDGVEPGGCGYTSDGGFIGRVRVADPRTAGARLCFGQPLGGDSAYTVFHAVELAPLLKAPWGPGDTEPPSSRRVWWRGGWRSTPSPSVAAPPGSPSTTGWCRATSTPRRRRCWPPPWAWRTPARPPAALRDSRPSSAATGT